MQCRVRACPYLPTIISTPSMYMLPKLPLTSLVIQLNKFYIFRNQTVAPMNVRLAQLQLWVTSSIWQSQNRLQKLLELLISMSMREQQWTWPASSRIVQSPLNTYFGTTIKEIYLMIHQEEVLVRSRKKVHFYEIVKLIIFFMNEMVDKQLHFWESCFHHWIREKDSYR